MLFAARIVDGLSVGNITTARATLPMSPPRRTGPRRTESGRRVRARFRHRPRGGRVLAISDTAPIWPPRRSLLRRRSALDGLPETVSSRASAAGAMACGQGAQPAAAAQPDPRVDFITGFVAATRRPVPCRLRAIRTRCHAHRLSAHANRALGVMFRAGWWAKAKGSAIAGPRIRPPLHRGRWGGARSLSAFRRCGDADPGAIASAVHGRSVRSRRTRRRESRAGSRAPRALENRSNRPGMVWESGCGGGWREGPLMAPPPRVVRARNGKRWRISSQEKWRAGERAVKHGERGEPLKGEMKQLQRRTAE